MTTDTDVVAQVEKLVEGEGVFSDVVLANVDLEALTTLLELRETGLTLDADGHDAAGDADTDGVWVKLLSGEIVICSAELWDCVARGVAVGVGRLRIAEAVELTQGGYLLKLVTALLVEIFFELRLV